MKKKSNLLKIFLLSTIFIGFNVYSIDLFAEEDENTASSEAKSDDAVSKKPKGMPGKKKEYKMVNIKLLVVLWKFFMKQRKINTI
jgi:hypothetical protein